MLPRQAIALALASFLAVGGCASTAARSADAAQISIHVSTYRWEQPNPGRGTGAPVPEPVAGARCTLDNEWGTWVVTTPEALEVEASRRLFRVTCKRDGFREDSQELACLSRGEQAALAGLRFAPLSPLALLVVPMAMAMTGGEAYRCLLEVELTPLS